MIFIKRLVLVVFIQLFMFMAACGSNPKADNIIDVGTTPAPSATPFEPVTPLPRMDVFGDSAAQTPEYGTNVKLEITGNVSHVFPYEKGSTLYGAVEYKNTGDCPLIVSYASFKFNVNGQTETCEFEPALSKYDVVMPGGSSYVCTWYQSQTAVEPGADIKLEAELTSLKSVDTRVDVLVENLYIADNYPGFSTLSGTLRGVIDTPDRLNVVNLGFYDNSGKLMAVWYFTKNAQIAKDDFKNFVVHIKGLPIENFSQKIASITAVAYVY